MKINTHELWSGADKSSVTYTTYLVEETPDIKNHNPRPAVIICGGGGFFKVTDREKEPAVNRTPKVRQKKSNFWGVFK